MSTTTTQPKKLYYVQVTVGMFAWAESQEKANEQCATVPNISRVIREAQVGSEEVTSIEQVPEEYLLSKPVGHDKKTVAELMYATKGSVSTKTK